MFLHAHMCAYMYVWMCVIASGPVERVYLSAPIVAIQGKKANLTVVVWPSHTRTLTFFWWFDNSSEVRNFSSHIHYCPIDTRCFILFTAVFSILPLSKSMSLFTKCESTELSHICKMWLHVTLALCLSGGYRAKMAGHIYLSRWLCLLQHPLIIQYVKGFM